MKELTLEELKDKIKKLMIRAQTKPDLSKDEFKRTIQMIALYRTTMDGHIKSIT